MTRVCISFRGSAPDRGKKFLKNPALASLYFSENWIIGFRRLFGAMSS